MTQVTEPTPQQKTTPQVRLDLFDNSSFDRGRPRWFEALWVLTRCFFFTTSLPWPNGIKRVLLRRLGAKVGKGVVIRPGVYVHFPWRLVVGNHCWIGDSCQLLNIAPITFEDHVALAHEVYLAAGGHDIRAAEQHDAVAVGVRGLVHDDDRLRVEREALERRRVCIVGPRGRRCRRDLSGRGGHATEHGEIGDDGRTVVLDRAHRTGVVVPLAQRNDLALAGDGRVAADVIGQVRGVDHVAQFALRDRAHRRPHLFAHRRDTGVDDHDALVTDLHRDVRTGAADHVHVALDGHHFHVALRRTAQHRRPCGLLRAVLSRRAL